MSYNVKDIEKIVGFKSWTIKKKVDSLLQIDADLYCNLGTDSSDTEKKQAIIKSRKIYNAIKKCNYELGSRLIQSMD
jgi:hypothetical protein